MVLTTLLLPEKNKEFLYFKPSLEDRFESRGGWDRGKVERGSFYRFPGSDKDGTPLAQRLRQGQEGAACVSGGEFTRRQRGLKSHQVGSYQNVCMGDPGGPALNSSSE